VHVADASRVVDVVAQLLDPARRETLDDTNRAEQARLREIYGSRKGKPLTSLAEARRRPAIDTWREDDIAQPVFTGSKVLDDFPLAKLVPYIDWTFFFTAWQLKGRFPQILEHPRYGEAARELYDHGRTLLDEIVDRGLLRAKATYGLWPAHAEGDDIVVFGDEARTQELLRFNMLRQQTTRGSVASYLSLADFVAPKATGLRDHIGAFAVTAGVGADEVAGRYEASNDDYSAIMVKALADRLAEAFAEFLHEQARRDWGYGAQERLSTDQLITEKYRGIRPAFGYPACPDHTEKHKLFELLGAERAGIHLTESCAMYPAASVSGIYLAHPAARYFTVGRLGRDQIEDYAARKGMTVAEVERWLGPNLGYDAA
jgi:5-methyltetrahydrofolate--homocysteine methyltransferase